MSDVRYQVQKNRIERSFMDGFEVCQQKDDFVIKNQKTLTNFLVIYPFDSGETDATWGRLKFKSNISGNTAFYVFVAASNDLFDVAEFKDSAEAKIKLEKMGAKRLVNLDDVLLYDLEGQYLYVGIQALGEDIDFSFSDMVVDRIGDNFMNTFPTIYRERNSFFHRYMSVLSSVYNDFDEKIEALPKLLDLDTCPIELLPEYGRWLGIDLGDGVFEEEIMRNLVKEAYSLNRMKGTRWCLERIVEIFLGGKGIIVERNQLSEVFTSEQIKEYNKIYGDSKQDVTLLLQVNLPQTKRNQLEFLLEQFLPIRCKLHIVELGQISGLDSHLYLDINAQIFNPMEGSLDDAGSLNQNLILM